MIDVKLDFQERISQVDKYLSFVWVSASRLTISNLEMVKENKIVLDDNSEIRLGDFLSDSDTFMIDQELVKILKSNSILLFYNLIEGTVNSLMNEFFGTLNANPTKYRDLELPIKRIWLKYKHRSFGVGNKRHDKYIVDTIEAILDEVVTISPKTVNDTELGQKIIHNYEAYSSETKANEISGNLDARKIRELFSLYGLPEITLNCNSMLKVKNKRNSLAHGNESFAQVGSNFTIDDLYKMKIEIAGFLEHLLNETENYISEGKYKKASA